MATMSARPAAAIYKNAKILNTVVVSVVLGGNP